MRVTLSFTLVFFSLGFLGAFAQTEVSDGQPVTVRNISWAGNKAFDSQTLARLVNLPASARYTKKSIPLDVLTQDLTRGKSDGKTAQGITSFYRNQGYFFFSYQVLTSPVANGQVDVQILLTEGPQMKLGQILVEGPSPLSAVEIGKLSGLSTGQVFNEFRVIESFDALRKSGKVKANAQVTPRLNPATQAIDIVYSFN